MDDVVVVGINWRARWDESIQGKWDCRDFIVCSRIMRKRPKLRSHEDCTFFPPGFCTLFIEQGLDVATYGMRCASCKKAKLWYEQ